MKEFFLKDSVLKVISFVAAIFLWAYIIAVVDPSVTLTVRNIPIRYTNQSVLEEKGLCLVEGSKNKVELKIKGSRKKIASIETKNIYATVDLTTISKTGSFSLPIAISIPYEYDEIVSKNPYNSSVIVDKIVTVEKEVHVITKGGPATGYIAGNAVPSERTVELSGAATVIDGISYVGVELDYDNRAAEINDELDIFFMNRENERVEEDDSIYNMVSTDVEAILVQCPIYKLKNVPVEIDARTNGGVSYRAQPTYISIYAESDVLEKIDVIKTEPINIDAMTAKTQEVKLVIPDGVYLRDGIKSVTVKTEKKD